MEIIKDRIFFMLENVFWSYVVPIEKSFHAKFLQKTTKKCIFANNDYKAFYLILFFYYYVCSAFK